MPDMTKRDLYKKVFEQIYPEIKDKKRGVLYITIHRILGEKNIKQADEICEQNKIKNNTRLDDDQPLFDFITDNESKYRSIVKRACKYVDFPACVDYLNSVNGQQKMQAEKGKTISSPQDVALCLIVPASVASNFKKGDQINVSDIENLIDAAFYFLCTEFKKADKLYLETIDNDILPDSNLEVYVRIDIPNGQEMIDKTIGYILKRNLPYNVKGTIIELACLKSLSGLQQFNRV